MHPLHQRWIRHRAMVVKGFLRHQVLELLDGKSMSGMEIMGELERRTNGLWKPSPGSIYPLLAWLKRKDHVTVTASNGSGMKRYELTDSGRAVLKEERKIEAKLRKEVRLFPPPFPGALWFRIPPEKTAGIRESMRKFMSAFFELGSQLEDRYSEHAIETAQEAIEEAAGRIEDINRKMKGNRR